MGMNHKLTYEQFYNMVRSWCIILDANRKQPRLTVKANKQEQLRSAEPKSASSRSSSFLPKDKWQAMSKEERDKYWEQKRKERKVNKVTKSDSQNPASVPTKSTHPANQANHAKPTTTYNAVEKFMSSQHAKPSGDKSVTLKLSVTKMSYHSSVLDVTTSSGSLIDGGANGGLAGADVRLISTGSTLADVTGINNTNISDVPIGTVAGLVETTDGPAVAVMHQYAYLGSGATIHSANQLGHFGLCVDDKPNNGKQRIVTPDGFTIPLAVRSGLLRHASSY